MTKSTKNDQGELYIGFRLELWKTEIDKGRVKKIKIDEEWLDPALYDKLVEYAKEIKYYLLAYKKKL